MIYCSLEIVPHTGTTHIFESDDIGMLSVSHQDFYLLRGVPLILVYNLAETQKQTAVRVYLKLENSRFIRETPTDHQIPAMRWSKNRHLKDLGVPLQLIWRCIWLGEAVLPSAGQL